nr:MAG: replication associated protein [Cressdnaviricota sp.]
MTQKTYRRICFTLNNYTEEELLTIRNIECGFMIFGEEVGENGTPHLQGYIEFDKSKRHETIKRLCPRMHFEATKGSAAQNITYCSKEGNVWTKGETKKQGERMDLIELAAEIEAGRTTDELIDENANLARIRGCLDRIEDIKKNHGERGEMTEGIWLWGPTGSGKSRMAFEMARECESYYVKPDDGEWWDDYNGQECVIIDDFRGEIRYGQLLRIIDRWPFQVKRRNRRPINFKAKKVIITSPLTPEEAYHGVLDRHDNIGQLLRRLHIIELHNVAEVAGRVILDLPATQEK